MPISDSFHKTLTPTRVIGMTQLGVKIWPSLLLAATGQLLTQGGARLCHLSNVWVGACGLAGALVTTSIILSFIPLRSWAVRRCQRMVETGEMAMTDQWDCFLPLDGARAPAPDTLAATWSDGKATIMAGRSWVSITSRDGNTLRLRGRDFDRFAALLHHHLERAAGHVKTCLGGKWLQLSVADLPNGPSHFLEVQGHEDSVLCHETASDLCDWLNARPCSVDMTVAVLADAVDSSRRGELVSQLEGALAGRGRMKCYSSVTITTTCSLTGIAIDFGWHKGAFLSRSALASVITGLDRSRLAA